MKYLRKIGADIYHRDIRLSHTGLKEFDRSPAHYQAYLQHGINTTAAMAEGSIAHGWILEDKFDESLLDPKIKTTVVKDDNIRIGQQTWENIQLMKEKILHHPAASKILTKGHAEMSIFGHINGVEVKARPDYLRPDDLVICELKTAQNASPDAWPKAVANFGYHLQAAFYCMLLEEVSGQPHWSWVWIVVEKSPPFEVGVYMPTEAMMDQARWQVTGLIDAFKLCKQDNHWPGYSAGIIEVDLPRWAQKGKVDYE